jgi:hypothetical protein
MFQDVVHPDLLIAQQHVYQSCGLQMKNVKKEQESKEYHATNFELNDLRIKFRVGKITPTKIGQFVTLWKRINKGPITPYDMQDQVDFFVISVRSLQGRLGQFVFSKAVLCEKGIMSQNEQSGKLAIRVYPVWDNAENAQAKKTQAWQLDYFFEIDEHKPVDILRIRKLFLFS